MLPISTALLSRARARRRALRRCSRAGFALAIALGAFGVAAAPRAHADVPGAVTTFHNDNGRTGQNLNEIILTPANVTPANFGRLSSRAVDGAIYGQPLYVPNVFFPNIADPIAHTSGSFHNTIYVATSHNTVYAFDADSSRGSSAYPLWVRTYTFASVGISPVSNDDVGSDDVVPEIGITGTPVIDASPRGSGGGNQGVIYFVTKTKESGNFFQRLHALDLGTGQERYGFGTIVNASVPGTGDGVDGDNNIVFDSLYENQQAALSLANGKVYIAFGSHSDQGPFHGWLLAYKPSADQQSMQQVAAFNTSPNGTTDLTATPIVPAGAGITMGGSGPVIDGGGNIFFTTGSGDFNVDLGGSEYGQSVVKLNFGVAPSPQPLPGPGPNGPVTDYFTPSNYADLNASGNDLGTGGLVMIPDGMGPNLSPNLIVAAGTEGTIYVLDRDNLGYNSVDDTQIVEELFRAVGSVYSSPAYYNGTVYIHGAGDVLKAFMFSGGYLTQDPTGQADMADPFGSAYYFGLSGQFDFPGASPVISANGDANGGSTNGIVWTLERMQKQDGSAPVSVLHGYKAYDPNVDNGVIQEIYTSLAYGSRDATGKAAAYAVPTVVNGKVFVGGTGLLTTFGLLSAQQKLVPIEADHFTVIGPNGGLAQRQTNYFSITAYGPDGNPMKLNTAMQMSYRDSSTNAIKYIGTVLFRNEATTVFGYAFRDLVTGRLGASDPDGHTTPAAAALAFRVNSTVANGFDHFTISGPTSVRSGSAATLVIRTVSGGGSPFTVYGIDPTTSDPLTPTIGSNPQTWHLMTFGANVSDVVPALPTTTNAQGVVVPGSRETIRNLANIQFVQPFLNHEYGSAAWPYARFDSPFLNQQTVRATLRGPGKHVIMVQSGGVTSSFPITVTK